MSYGAAANIVGGELQGWASVLDKHAMFSEYQKELARQQQYRDQGAQLFQGMLEQAGPRVAGVELGQGKQQRLGTYADVAGVPLETIAPPTQQSTSSGRDKAAVRMRGEQRATLGAYSDWSLKQLLNNIQNQEALKQLSSFAGGTAGVFPYKMYKAQHSMDDLSMIGAAISSIGGGAANFAQYANAPQTATSQNQGVPLNSIFAAQQYGTTDPYTGAALALGTY